MVYRRTTFHIDAFAPLSDEFTDSRLAAESFFFLHTTISTVLAASIHKSACTTSCLFENWRRRRIRKRVNIIRWILVWGLFNAEKKENFCERKTSFRKWVSWVLYPLFVRWWPDEGWWSQQQQCNSMCENACFDEVRSFVSMASRNGQTM